MQIKPFQIVNLIEERYRVRGMDYFRKGMVELISVSAEKVTARCAGTRIYKTLLELDHGKLVGECTCPAFEDFGPCKHRAAVAHAVMTKDYAPSKDYDAQKEETKRIEAYLMGRSKNQLVAMMMQIMHEDSDLQCMIEQEIK